MKRIVGQALTVVAVAVFATTLTPACAENDSSIFIRSALAPSQTRTPAGCSYTADPTQATLFEGVFDAAVRDSYVSVLLVGNQLIPRGDAVNTRAESNRAHLNGAIVRVTDPNGGEIGAFTSLSSGFIDPGLNNQPSFGNIAVTTIDAPTRAKIATSLAPGQTKLVIANVKAFGETLGGIELESGEFQIPIRVCNQCLISFETGDDPATPGVDCNLPLGGTGGGGGGGAAVASPCFPGQDETTPCQTCPEREACRTR